MFCTDSSQRSKQRLPEAARDVYELIEQFRHSDAKELRSFRLLCQVFDEQCEVDNSGSNPIQVKAPEQIPCDNVLNPADPDALSD